MKIVKWFIKTSDGIKGATLSDVIAMTSSNKQLIILESTKGKEIHKVIEFIQ
jgi:hypothetical protein